MPFPVKFDSGPFFHFPSPTFVYVLCNFSSFDNKLQDFGSIKGIFRGGFFPSQQFTTSDFIKVLNVEVHTHTQRFDDIFFIWTDGEDSLKEFLVFYQKYSEAKNMKSVIKFVISQSTKTINFLDVFIALNK